MIRMQEEKYYIISRYAAGRWVRTVRRYSKELLKRDLCVTLGLVDPKEGEVICEIGAGEGRFIPYVTAEGARYVGMDISRRILYFAKTYLNSHSDLVDLVVAEAKRPPFRDKVFDKAFCVGTSYYVSNKERMIKELIRVTRNRLVINFINLYSPIVALAKIKHKLAVALTPIINSLLKFNTFIIILRALFDKKSLVKRIITFPFKEIEAKIEEMSNERDIFVGPFHPDTPRYLSKYFANMNVAWFVATPAGDHLTYIGSNLRGCVLTPNIIAVCSLSGSLKSAYSR